MIYADTIFSSSHFPIFTSNKFHRYYGRRFELWSFIKVSENKHLDIFTDHAQMVNKPTHISGSLIEHVNNKKTLMKEFSINVTVESIYFLDHDALRIVIEKNPIDFQTIL